MCHTAHKYRACAQNNSSCLQFNIWDWDTHRFFWHFLISIQLLSHTITIKPLPSTGSNKPTCGTQRDMWELITLGPLGHRVQISSKSIYCAGNKKLIFNHQPSTKQLPSRSSTAVTSPRFNWIIRRFSWDVRLSRKPGYSLPIWWNYASTQWVFFHCGQVHAWCVPILPLGLWHSKSSQQSSNFHLCRTFIYIYSKFHLTLAPFHPFNRPGGPSIQVAFPQRMMFQALNHLHHQSARHLPPTIASGFHRKTFGSDCVPQWHSTGWVNMMVKYMVKYGIGDVCFDMDRLVAQFAKLVDNSTIDTQ